MTEDCREEGLRSHKRENCGILVTILFLFIASILCGVTGIQRGEPQAFGLLLILALGAHGVLHWFMTSSFISRLFKTSVRNPRPKDLAIKDRQGRGP